MKIIFNQPAVVTSKTNLGEPFENPLGAVHVGWSSHEEADMEGCLPHGSSVLHVPAVLREEVRVCLGTGALSQLLQQGAPFKLETEGRLSKLLCIILIGLGLYQFNISDLDNIELF